jgi:hypothetical protein
MLRRLIISPEVTEQIPTNILSGWRRGPLPGSFRCPVCGRTDLVDDGTPITVCSLRHQGTSGAVFVHAACGPSTIWHTTPRSLLVERQVFVQRSEPSPQCLLVIIQETQLMEIGPDSPDWRSVSLGRALASGFELILTEPFGVQPPSAEAWTLRLDLCQGTTLLSAADPGLERHNGIIPSDVDEWLAAAAADEEVVVVLGAGTVLLQSDLFDQIQTLTGLGQVVAARVRTKFESIS